MFDTCRDVYTHVHTHVHYSLLVYSPVLQEKLRMESLRCRAYTRRHIHEREVEVGEMEKRVAEAKKQLAAIINENER